MKTSFQTRRTCRLCGSQALSLALGLQPTPIGDNYLLSEQVGRPEEIFNLDVMACADCGQAQLRDVVSPDLLYPDFPYVTSVSIGLPEHFRRFAEAVVTRYAIRPGSLVLEIGSNEGPMLRAFKAHGCRVLGVEPAAAIAQAATTSGVPTLARYFDRKLAGEIAEKEGKATVIAANNVLANIDDLDDVLAGVSRLLAPDGILVMETSYWLDVVTKGLIDTIYHEHISYFSVAPLRRFFAKHGLQLIVAERNTNKGGSIRLTAQRIGGKYPLDDSVEKAIALEEELAIFAPTAFAQCRSLLDRLRKEIHEVVDPQVGTEIAAYGASVGSTTMLYEFHLGSTVGYILDDNPRKQGKFSPGFHLPCVAATEVAERNPACTIMLAWRYVDQIVSRHNYFTPGTGRMLLPLPSVRRV